MTTTMKTCPFCKTPIPDDCIYCDICGEKLRKCSSCGAFAKSKRCTKCGSPTEEIDTGHNFSQPENGKRTIPDHLVCLSSDLRIGLSNDAVIGRRGSYGNAFQNFPSISGLHARLIQIGDVWKIEDVGSSYGTFLNGKELERNKPERIQVGDIVKFANIEFKVTE